jgi:hypothetical protein
MDVCATAPLKLVPIPVVGDGEFGLHYLLEERLESLMEMHCRSVRAAPQVASIDPVSRRHLELEELTPRAEFHLKEREYLKKETLHGDR